MVTINPIFASALAPFRPREPDPLEVSGYLTQPPRTQAQASADRAEPWLKPWLASDLYIVIYKHRFPHIDGRGICHDRSFTIGGEVAELTDKTEALGFLRASWADNDSARVILRPAAGKPEDVSEEFARLWMLAMREEGASRDEVFSVKFIRENVAVRDWEG